MCNFKFNLYLLPLNWNLSGICYDSLWISHINFCAWFIKKTTWILFEPEWYMMELLPINRKWDFLQSILESQKFIILPKYTLWTSTSLSLWSLFCWIHKWLKISVGGFRILMLGILSDCRMKHSTDIALFLSSPYIFLY
jgi:hypothetical protein